jgi:SAM-dependent methyltransferase
VAKHIEFLNRICSAPGTNERLQFDERGYSRVEGGSRYRALRGVPILRAEPPPTVIMPSSHVSGAIAQDRVHYMCGLSGYTLLMGGGNLAFSHPNVVDVEFNLYTNTDVVADAHLLPFQDDTFDLFFAMNVFEHLRQPFVAAKEALRVLKPGGELHLHTAFLQPLHEEPIHYFNATEFGGREWLRDFESVECLVSPNFNPLYSLAWFSFELLALVEKHLGSGAAKTIGNLTVAEAARFWTQPLDWNPAMHEMFFKLPEQAQRRIAAGFDFKARKPLG